jgi:preprotein translocase subunit SecE
MAVAAEARKMDKGDEVGTPGGPGWMSGPLGWAPRKLKELRQFLTEVRSELKKVTWPDRNEVQSTTIVVIFTTIFFGFYLYLLDLGFSELFSRFLGRH